MYTESCPNVDKSSRVSGKVHMPVQRVYNRQQHNMHGFGWMEFVLQHVLVWPESDGFDETTMTARCLRAELKPWSSLKSDSITAQHSLLWIEFASICSMFQSSGGLGVSAIKLKNEAPLIIRPIFELYIVNIDYVHFFVIWPQDICTMVGNRQTQKTSLGLLCMWPYLYAKHIFVNSSITNLPGRRNTEATWTRPRTARQRLQHGSM
jgi:hypothetical protein